jgi:hypothetical protein
VISKEVRDPACQATSIEVCGRSNLFPFCRFYFDSFSIVTSWTLPRTAERQFQLRHSRSRACLGNHFTAVLADFLATLEGARRSLTRAATFTSNPDNNRHGPNFSAKERASWRLLHIQSYEKWLPIDVYSGFIEDNEGCCRRPGECDGLFRFQAPRDVLSFRYSPLSDSDERQLTQD